MLDELHKYSEWKSLLKGLFDTYGDRVHLIVTSLAHFQAQTQAAHAFQLVVSLAYQPVDCFRVHRPVVPARTFLSQLL